MSKRMSCYTIHKLAEKKSCAVSPKMAYKTMLTLNFEY